MDKWRLLPAFFLLASSWSGAADLSKIDRTIGKEPAYRSKPKYCLLVFGPEAKSRVWLVQDGDTLYVDRNGSGDLTEKGKAVIATGADISEEICLFHAGDVLAGNLRHRELSIYVTKLDSLADQEERAKALLARDPKAKGYVISIEMELPPWQGKKLGGRVPEQTSFADANGVLQFSDRPQDAPIVHFGGPWQVTLFNQCKLVTGREKDLVLAVGTPGAGPGTTTYVDYEGVIPEDASPTVEIAYPPKSPGGPQMVERYTLTHRC